MENKGTQLWPCRVCGAQPPSAACCFHWLLDPNVANRNLRIRALQDSQSWNLTEGEGRGIRNSGLRAGISYAPQRSQAEPYAPDGLTHRWCSPSRMTPGLSVSALLPAGRLWPPETHANHRVATSPNHNSIVWLRMLTATDRDPAMPRPIPRNILNLCFCRIHADDDIRILGQDCICLSACFRDRLLMPSPSTPNAPRERPGNRHPPP